MRKVVSGLFVSLDGVAQSPDQWQFAFDEEMGAALAGTLETCDTILLGRVTFTEWAGYWPTVTSGEDAGFAQWINESPKYVVSSTLDSVDDWSNSTLVKGDLAAAVKELKAGEGKDITVAGSPTLVRSLLEQDLLDELVLLIHPVVAGEGRKKLFADDAALKKLELVSAQPTSSGVIIATYRPAR
ncbi:Riboflavin biosynthesis protein RibD [Streptomyces venezuelae]|uniref:dihydrofolate reductase family protein n=1 Tax=Streptomyces gardneri TaxID=66892 RepID=UPI0006BDAD6C|nr:dihydrofolate reductase family protein [Streptomyces gardneri]ALO13511.1 Riboflavin biosynthesis protein RibD [Streptomyces venezuelae]QPK50132.1 dihydrofolate reductase family protein [Streptomyces gardneri]WRK41721.1 dihydrofolate reductase family protein [Streptomyces venezuelae]CUM35739.1 Dihydrofolate reductase [Streptomyces venezuelae]